MNHNETNEFDITCLMPCLNEAETIELCVQQALHSINQLGIRGEVLIADNGSTDGSQQIATNSGARVITVERKGYGSALQAGIMSAKGKYVVMGDADGSYTWDRLEDFYSKLISGSDLVMGNRFAGTIFPNAMPFLNRYIGNPVLSGLGRLFFDVQIRDFHCGLRGFSRQRIMDLGVTSTGMEFASEMVIKSTLGNLSIAEVPTDLRPDGRSRAPHLRPIPDGWRHLRLMLSYSPKWSMRIPGFFLVCLGSALGLLGYITDPSKDDLSFGLHTTLIGSVLVITGVQAILSSIIGELAINNTLTRKTSTFLTRLQRGENLEKILLVGSLLALLGLLGFISSFFMWGRIGFGQLQPDQLMKPILLSATVLTVGIQVIFSSLLFETFRRAK